MALIAFFNYYYTFLQLDPKDLADQLKRQGASIPSIRPGRNTADYITGTLQRMSILGSAFLGALAAAPTVVEALTKLQVGVRPSPMCSWEFAWLSPGMMLHLACQSLPVLQKTTDIC